MQTTALKGFRLSLQQNYLWSLQYASQAYRAQCMMALEGDVVVPLLQQALLWIMQRHAVLRTTFQHASGMEIPLQIITNRAEPSFSVISLERLDSSQQDLQLDEQFAAMLQVPFNLTEGPVVHALLFRMSANVHTLLLCLPALCADSATLKHFITELHQAYTFLLTGEDFPESPLQYADVSAWQNELLQDEDASESLAYWRATDLSLLAEQRLPFERATKEAPEESCIPLVQAVAAEDALLEQMQIEAQRAGVSCEAYLLACWQILLWRLRDGAPDLIGVVCDGRPYEELTTALGLYSRIVPFRASLAMHLTFEQVLALVDHALKEVVEQQMYFSWELAGTDVAGETNFFPFCFEFTAWPASLSANGPTFSLRQHFCCFHTFTVKLNARQIGEKLRLEIQYRPSRISSFYAPRLADMFCTLLRNAVEHLQAPISSLPLLTSEEQRQLLQSFTGVEKPVSIQFLHHSFEAQVQRIPNQVAVVCGADELTYQQLNQQANRLAHMLRREGVGPNVMVGLCMERSVQMLVGLLAILKAGGAYVPLDPDYPPARLAWMLNELTVRLVLTQNHLKSQLAQWEGSVLCLDSLTALEQEAEVNPIVPLGQQDIAYVIYTSGSTGKPKGVVIRHCSVSNYTQALCEVLNVESGLHFATVSTLAADLGNTAIFCSLASGGCLHVLPYEIVTSGEAFARYTQRQPLDVLKIVPSHFSALLNSAQSASIFPTRYLILGGEALSGVLLARLRELGCTCCVINHYGPTEMTIGALVNVLGTPTMFPGRDNAYDTIPIGRPIANTQAFILDRCQQLAPVGVTGELYLGGLGLAWGYFNQPEQTQERFLPHPFAEGQELRVYRTGDLARVTEDGLIQFIGRLDDQVKVRGFRIEPGEIEAVLRQHNNVQECVVQLWENEQGEPGLVAYVVAKPSSSPSIWELRDFLAELLPKHMVPSHFVFLRALPLTSNGKVDRQMLPPPEEHERQGKSPYVAPRSPIEEILVGIWEDVLKVKQIGVHDNFADIGGHSLLATQIISRLRIALQVELPLRYLFDAPTVAGLALFVEQAMQDKQGYEVLPLIAAVHTEHSQDLPLSFAQQRLWFLDQLEPDASVYNVPAAIRLTGSLNIKALEQSLRDIVRRHKTLRTTFQVKDKEPVQVISDVWEVHLPLVDVSALPAEVRQKQVQRLLQQEANQPFNLSKGPLMRVRMLYLEPQNHVLLLTMHHIISDGWSRNILLQEVTALYNGYVEGQPASLAPLPIQYADYALWQRQWLQGEVLEEQLQYWRQQLADLSPLDLPTDWPRPAVQTTHGARERLLLSSALLYELQGVARRQGVTLFMLLLAAFQVWLARSSGQSDIAVGTDIAGRSRRELEGLIGFFVNTLVLRTDLSGSPSFEQVLKRVREVCLEAYAHQDIPFEKVVEELHPQRDLSRSPLFQVFFSLQQQAQQAATPVLHEVEVSRLGQENATAKFDLTLTLIENQQGLNCVLEYNTDLFAAERIVRWLAQWQTLLSALVADPQQSITRVPLLPAAEREQVLRTWNQTQRARPAPCSVPALVAQQAARVPERVVVRYEQESLTYGAVQRRVEQLARGLQAWGVGPEQVVGLVLEREPSLLLSMLALWRCGAAVLPLEPSLPPSRLQQVLQQAQPRLVLTDERGQEELARQGVSGRLLL
ncbi:MAG TPA: amino acid adenylation domain-containing protein, partial [Ktedonosporobacter sp.]|nr:amino acid adenylation domain-containing protein [Ktedonosporobacter sp.]